jgi:peptidase E
MSGIKLEEIYSNPSVKSFGDAFRKSLMMEEIRDYASFVELGYSESKEQFCETLQKFLRRYDTPARKLHLIRPSEDDLENIVKLVDRFGVEFIKTAILSYALVKSGKE